MKDVIIRVRCDGCGGENAQTYTETNSKGKPVEIDLDQPCREEHERLRREYEEALERAKLILAPIVALADEKGVAPDKTIKTPKPKGAGRPKGAGKLESADGERVCILCWDELDTDAKLKTHIQREHGLGDSLVAFYGRLCPADGEPFPRVAHHIRQGHKDLELTHYSQAFRWAKENNDPHGVLAKQVAELQKLANAA